jgi:hypothetical protein
MTGCGMMVSFTLTPEQEKILDSGGDPIAICRPNGTLCGFVSTKNLPTPEEIELTERDLDDPSRTDDPNQTWDTSEEVLAHLRQQEGD